MITPGSMQVDPSESVRKSQRNPQQRPGDREFPDTFNAGLLTLWRRQINLERGAGAGRALDVDDAVVAGDDSVDDGEAKAGANAGGFGGEEGFEKAFEGVGVHAGTGVGNEEAEAVAGHFFFVGNEIERNADLAFGVGHGLPGVDAQVHDDLVDLVGIDKDFGKVWGDGAGDFDRFRNGDAQHAHGIRDDFAKGHQRGRGGGSAAEGQDELDEVARGLGGFDDLFQPRLRGMISGQIHLGEFGVAENGSEKVFEFVRNAGGDDADAVETLGMAHLFVEADLFGDVAATPKAAKAKAGFVADGRCVAIDGATVAQSTRVMQGALEVEGQRLDRFGDAVRQGHLRFDAPPKFLAAFGGSSLGPKIPYFGEATVGMEKLAVARGDDDAFEAAFALGFEKGFLKALAFFRLFAFGNVAAIQHETGRLWVEENRVGARFNIDPRTVLALDFSFEQRPGAGSLKGVLQEVLQRGSIIGMDKIEGEAANEFFVRVSAELQAGRAGVLDSALAIDGQNQVGAAFQETAETFFAGGQFTLDALLQLMICFFQFV